MLGVPKQNDATAHHNIFFSDNYAEEFDDIFKRKVPPSDSTIYVCITSKTDPDDAPPDHENWFVLTNAPYLSDAFEWATHQTEYADQIKNNSLPKPKIATIIFERIQTPQIFKTPTAATEVRSTDSLPTPNWRRLCGPTTAHAASRICISPTAAPTQVAVYHFVTLSGMAAAACVLADT